MMCKPCTTAQGAQTRDHDITYTFVGARQNFGSCEKGTPILSQVEIRINARLGVLPSLPRRSVTSWIMMHTRALVDLSGEGASSLKVSWPGREES